MLTLLIMALFSDSEAIHTTVTNGSRVAFIAQTPLCLDTVEHDSLRYIHFSDSPLSDSTGYPELPMITCLVAFPDSVTPHLEYSVFDERTQSVLPVYPSAAHVISNEFTPALIDSFVKDSTAYLSDEFWPAERVRIIGETRICDQRLLQVQLFPAQYRASDSTLSTVASFSISVSFDSSEAVWSNKGLGHFQQMVHGSPIVGYSPIEQTYAPVPTYFGQIDPEDGPGRMPDYVIICASGLYEQCEDAIDALAEHRVSLNGFDVALVTTDDILEDFGRSANAITPEIIRRFTQHMWAEWGVSSSNKTPGYLLLIGDHEDEEFSDEPWFLPTHCYPVDPSALGYFIGNDEWYVYFNQPASVNNAFPDMCVGRLSVKNGDTPATDTLSTLIYNLIDLESPITQAPIIDYRRRILRLAGAGQAAAGVYHQNFGLNNRPDTEWTADISSWMNYDYSNFYCGDGRWFTNTDLSRMESNEWVTNCIDELNRGAGVAFYTDHGEFHMFSAGLEWCPLFINDPRDTKGARDSTFNNYQIENYLNDPGTGYSAPFILSLSCLTGTYNHTVAEHRGRTSHPYFCFDDGSDTGVPPAYNFGTDCLAEKLLKNTDVPVAGVFACSEISYMSYYEYYGKGILEAIFTRGEGRLGDAIAVARLQYEDNFTSSNGSHPNALGQFNLLGDPALDISDRVRFPSKCDLVVYQNDILISEYPVEVLSGISLPLRFTVYNNGAQNSGSFNTKIVIMNGLNISTINVSCASIDARDSTLYEASWTCPNWFDPPMEIQVIIEVDDQHDCSDSWRGNNSSSMSVQLNDTYPVDSNWIDDYWVKPVEGVISTTPILTNLDSDDELEVVVLTGSTLSVYEHDGSKKWELSGEGFCGSIQPMAVDLDRDGKSELIVACSEGIKIVRSDASLGGVVQQLITVSSTVFTVGDMDSSTAGLELCTAEGSSINLYEWNNSAEQFEYSLTRRFTEFQVEVSAVSLCCADLGGSSMKDAILCISSLQTSEKLSGFAVYDWDNATTLYLNTWERFAYTAQPAVGELAGTAMVGFPFCQYSSGTEKPAVLVEPGQSTELLCEEGFVDAYQLNYGVFADWTAVSGADVFILPSEMQCFAWNEEGLSFNPLEWPTEVYSGSYQGASISPTALGNLDNTVNSDVLFSVAGILFAFDSNGELLDGLNFPITLPDNVLVLGGFSIADIDEDGVIEIVFGSSDSRLHCWELGECTEGYAPWPQFQHDFGRTGVLE